MAKIELTDGEIKQILSDATRLMAGSMITVYRAHLELLTTKEVCGLLNITKARLDKIKGIPRITLIPNSAYRYRACDVATFIESRTEGK